MQLPEFIKDLLFHAAKQEFLDELASDPQADLSTGEGHQHAEYEQSQHGAGGRSVESQPGRQQARPAAADRGGQAQRTQTERRR